MKKIIIIFFFLTKFAYAETKIIKIASVNETLITNIDLQNEIIVNKLLFGENLKNIEEFSLNNLIDQAIKQSEIKKNNIKVNINLIENEYKKITNSYKLSEKITSKIKDKIFEKIKIEAEWNTLISQIYGWKTNINLSEINEIILNKNNKNSGDISISEKEKLIELEKNKKFKVYSTNHLDEKKKIALIKLY